MTPQQINTAIVTGSFTNEELNTISAALTFARGQLTRQAVFTLVVGKAVKFTSSRTGARITGTVVKVNRKFIHVKETGTLAGVWRVPANMLSAA
jgi:hypothetical protein